MKTIPNVANRTIFCDDNLDVMAGINDGCIDLIYLDPPFNKNKKFTAPIGSSAEGASFKDIFREEDLKKEWLWTIKEDQPELYHFLDGMKGVGKPYNFAYLSYMAIRLLEMKRILKDTGSIYLHCDPNMSHYLKTTMDCIFGENNFRNEIVWRKYAGRKNNAKNKYSTQHDVVLFYAKSTGNLFYGLWEPHTEKEISKKYRYKDEDGRRYRLSWGRKYQLTGEQKRLYLDESKGRALGNLWVEDGLQLNTSSSERTGYPTQKPLALLERVIKASSNEGDLVLDPFCGCATTCVAAEKLDRQWVGIDISVKAYELVQKRLKKEVDKPQGDIFKGDTALTMRTDPPVRTDQDADYREQKFVYVISHPNFDGEYKVGIAKDWKSRLNSYQTSDPDRQYKVEFKLETPWFREIEQHIHDLFPNKHEWVQGDLDTIIQSIKDHKPV